MRNLFTLIELIVVIAVLGILAAIIIPNISSFQEEANDTAIVSNVKNLQTSVDMYAMDNFNILPTLEQPTEQVPEPIDFSQVYPDYTRDLPETEGVKYWVDFNGKVWASTIDAPTGVSYDTVNLKWNGVENAAYYNLFKTTNNITSSVDKKKMVFIKKVEDSGNEISVPMPSLQAGEKYLVNAVDKNKFESAPVGTGYTGYENDLPIAVIGMTPSSSIKTNTSISWNYDGSTDPDGDSILKAEWEVDGSPVTSPPATFTAGDHTVKLRVQDDRGNWSSWKERIFTVTQHITFTSKTFTYTGNYQTWTVPETGTYQLEVWGAQGGKGGSSSYLGGLGGKGAYAYGEKYLTKGQTLYIYVGEQGLYPNHQNKGGSGGGATDIRTVNGSWSDSNSLSSRVIVAGGGGGGTGNHYTWTSLGTNRYDGGHGGLSGYDGNYGGASSSRGYGGTQNSGGASGIGSYTEATSGGFGFGGRGGNGDASNTRGGWNGGGYGGYGYGGAGGGGGGYYGGGGGNASGTAMGAGGGGSSFISGLSNAGVSAGQRTGNGQAKVSYVGN